MTEPTYRPFSNGTQYMDWCARNCDRCTKAYDEETETVKCQIQWSLFEAEATGVFSEESARRIGYLDAGELAYTWDCPERDSEDGSDRRRREFEAAERAGQGRLFEGV